MSNDEKLDLKISRLESVVSDQWFVIQDLIEILEELTGEPSPIFVREETVSKIESVGKRHRKIVLPADHPDKHSTVIG